ncbi:MAG: C39 family peptidase, partial [Candidatus Cloacimonetes bacterium]|nr:C39 family peptidase [Candidatus Cloacimonadota bacterium]
IDGLAGTGHVNRFYQHEGDLGNDPFGTGDPTFFYADCTADFMGTNQDWWSNRDGISRFYAPINGTANYDFSECETYTPRRKDMTRGLRQFFESRGYTVTSNYNQRIYGWNGNTTGFTFANYKTYIDSGVPVIIHIDGHMMLGVGYDDTTNTVYLHNTWDYGLHSMTWGGYYSGMEHIAMSVLTLAPLTITCSPLTISQTLGQNLTTNLSLSISNPGSQVLNYNCSTQVSTESVLDETFASTSIPAGWTQSHVTGTTQWVFDVGGNGSNNPSVAFDGQYNARLWFYNSAVETKLITPSMNLLNTDRATLTFYHTQVTVNGTSPPYSPYNDRLKVYYRTTSSGTWTLLETYPAEIATWKKETLVLPNLSSTYYIAFEGYAYRGAGVCLDKVVVTKQLPSASWLSINGAQTYTGSIAVGGAAQTLTVNINTTGLAGGSYTSAILVNSTNSSTNLKTIPVTLNVTSPNSVVITAPAISTVWQSGTAQNITWNYWGTNPTVQIRYSTNGSTFTNIATVPTVFGINSYTWTVPFASSTLCKIKIIDSVWPFYYEVNSDNFSIVRPLIGLSQLSYNMGSVLVNSTSTAVFTIFNSGTGVLSGDISTPTGFSVAANRGVSTAKQAAVILGKDLAEQLRNTLAYTVPAGSNRSFTLTFAPTAMQAYNGSVTITHNAEGASKTISVTGQGVKPTLVPSVTSITLNSMQYLEMEEVFTIANTGNLPLNYTLSIPDSISWLKVNNSATTSNTIAVGGSAQEIYLLLTSNTFNQGTYYGVINGTSDDPDMLSFSIPVVVNLSSPITISSPTGGESILSGSLKTITWNYDNPNHPSGTTVKLYYARITGPVIVWLSIATIPCQTGENSYQWTAPTVFSNTLYKIKVSESSWPYYGHYTDTFTVVEGAPLPPINLQVSIDNENGDLQLTWGRAPVGTITGFKIYSCPNPLFALEDTTLLGTTTFEMRWIIPAAEIIDKQFYKVTAIREP